MPIPLLRCGWNNSSAPFPARLLLNSADTFVFGAIIICMYAQKFQVDVVIRGVRKACPLDWLDQFCMRNFTNSADFDDTLPVADGRLEASFRLTPERFAEGLSAWLTQRGKGEGELVRAEVTQVESGPTDHLAMRGGRAEQAAEKLP
jgi:hypothetical protein